MNAEQLLKIMDSKMEELKCYFSFIVRNEIENIISTNNLLKRLEKERYEDNQLCSSAVKKEKKIGLSFKEAVILCVEGKNLKRTGWIGTNWSEAYIYFHEDHHSIVACIPCFGKYINLKSEDYLANDWEIVE